MIYLSSDCGEGHARFSAAGSKLERLHLMYMLVPRRPENVGTPLDIPFHTAPFHVEGWRASGPELAGSIKPKHRSMGQIRSYLIDSRWNLHLLDIVVWYFRLMLAVATPILSVGLLLCLAMSRFSHDIPPLDYYASTILFILLFPMILLCHIVASTLNRNRSVVQVVLGSKSSSWCAVDSENIS